MQSDVPVMQGHSVLHQPCSGCRVQIQRSKLPADWRKRLAAIRAKAKEISTASGGPGSDDDFDYWAACSYAASLEGSATRSLLGTLTGTAGDWARIAKAYEKQSALQPSL